MSHVKNIVKKVKVSDIEKVIGAQILFYSYINSIWLNKSEFDMLVHIAKNGYNKETTLREIVSKNIFKSEQCVRNTRNKLVKLGMLKETSKRIFEINPEISTEKQGNVLYEVKILNV